MNSKLNAKINLLQAFEGNVVSLDETFKDSAMTAKNGNTYVPLEALKGKRWICIDDLKAEHFFQKSNGDVQLQVEINKKREVDRFENTHSISLQQTKATRESGAAKKWCGDAREFVFSQKAVEKTIATAESQIAEANLASLEDTDELDF